MKILFVTRGFPSDKDPMSGNYEAVQARAIATKGHEVSVIAIRWRNLLHIFDSRKIYYREVDGVHVYECKGLSLSIPHFYFPKLELSFREWQFRRVFKKYSKENGTPDVVHAHIVLQAAPVIYLKKIYNSPFVITEHWSRILDLKTPKRVINQMSAYQCADRVICVSSALSKTIYEKCGVRSIVINNMVDDRFFKTKKTEHKGDSFKFITVGALRKGKRFDLLVEAFALCHFPENVSLDIIGEGEERQFIESKLLQYSLMKQVKLLGVKKPEEVSDLLCNSDCFVLSSRLETFSIVVIEAMAKGLPVIVTKCGGPETFVRPKDGLLVEKENAEDLSRAMKYMLEHYQEYNVEEIRQHCHDNFSQDVIADKIISVYKDVLK